MKTYQIIISEDQLKLIQDSLISHQENIILTESEYSESQMLIFMIEDTIQSKDSETIQGFCY